jgi:hypothetical protein
MIASLAPHFHQLKAQQTIPFNGSVFSSHNKDIVNWALQMKRRNAWLCPATLWVRERPTFGQHRQKWRHSRRVEIDLELFMLLGFSLSPYTAFFSTSNKNWNHEVGLLELCLKHANCLTIYPTPLNTSLAQLLYTPKWHRFSSGAVPSACCPLQTGCSPCQASNL